MRGTRTTLEFNRNHKEIIHNSNLNTAINTIKEKLNQNYPLIPEEIKLEYKTKGLNYEKKDNIKFEIKILWLENEIKIGELEILK